MIESEQQATDEVMRPTCTAWAHQEPFMYAVAANLEKVLPLGKPQHLALWKRVLDLYAREQRGLPEFLHSLCQEAFVENLLHNEVFWSLVGSSMTREHYAHATDYLPAVYAAAALLAAKIDQLPLTEAETSLVSDAPHVRASV